MYSTGLTIDPYQWDADRQRAYTNQKGRTDRETYIKISSKENAVMLLDAITLVARACNWAKSTLLLRSMATNR